ncbi:hypothetical protein [Methylobacterium sp. WL19]|uniref:hypothetical protein n=1 Tax=Methylobacterium sp. WL19 TaxID=2603896 RepID=UPI0011CB8B63|nr:hypothetical protein [Methylobacterium sp. WL19]TXN33942.1 hypothetical protein FV220_00395 [Methylobacterium sp. WL19]
MAIEAEALRALSEMASQGEWSLGKVEGGYRFLDAAGIPSKPGPDRNVKWSGFARFVVEMEDDATCSGRSNLEFVAALVNAYRDGSLIHRSALAEDTARAAEGWEPIETAPRDGTEILLGSYPQTYEGKPVPARVTLGYWTQEEDLKVEIGDCGGECRCPEYRFDDPYWMSSDGGFSKENPATHWCPLPAPPALPLTKEAADANR